MEGSLADPGGRFNIGDIDQARFPIFPTLYLAEDKETALQEALCRPVSPEVQEKALESALTDGRSISIVSVCGRLESLIDLNQPETLRGFVDLIKGLGMPKSVLRTAGRYGIQLEVIRTVDRLIKTLLEPNWRAWPMQFDVPASTQIFGRLVKDAGIEGILYPSKYNGRNCIAMFPQSFQNTSSFVELSDKPPRGVKRTRLDSNNWIESECAKVPVVDDKLIGKIMHTGRLGGLIRQAIARILRFWPFWSDKGSV